MSKGDFHIHSKYSLDSLSDVRTIMKVCRKVGLEYISITDHESLTGSIQAKTMEKEFGLCVVQGMEIKTDKGDILALRIGEEIYARTFDEVIEKVHSQGGVAVLPHPYRGHRDIEIISKKVDLIEVHNGRGTVEENNRAMALAKLAGKPVLAGSDAHFWTEIGNSINEFEDLERGAVDWTGQRARGTELFFSGIVKDARGNDLRSIPYHLKKFIQGR